MKWTSTGGWNHWRNGNARHAETHPEATALTIFRVYKMAIIGGLSDFDDDVDAGDSETDRKFFVVATLETDKDQRRLLEYLMDEGIKCHSLTL